MEVPVVPKGKASKRVLSFFEALYLAFPCVETKRPPSGPFLKKGAASEVNRDHKKDLTSNLCPDSVVPEGEGTAREDLPAARKLHVVGRAALFLGNGAFELGDRQARGETFQLVPPPGQRPDRQVDQVGHLSAMPGEGTVLLRVVRGQDFKPLEIGDGADRIHGLQPAGGLGLEPGRYSCEANEESAARANIFEVRNNRAVGGQERDASL